MSNCFHFPSAMGSALKGNSKFLGFSVDLFSEGTCSTGKQN